MDFRFDAGSSADGRLRFEHRRSEADPDPRAGDERRAFLFDAGTGEALAEGTDWDWSEITLQEDGALFLRLIHRSSDALFRITAGSRSFSDWGVRGPERPLAELAAAIAAERSRLGDFRTNPGYRFISRYGTMRVDMQTMEWSNSHWVNAPRVVDLLTGGPVLDLWGSDWDSGVPAFTAGRKVLLSLRRHRGGATANVELDLERSAFRLLDTPDPYSTARPLADLSEVLKARRFDETFGPGARPVAGSPFAAWRMALALLVGALCAIALVAFVAWRMEG